MAKRRSTRRRKARAVTVRRRTTAPRSRRRGSGRRSNFLSRFFPSSIVPTTLSVAGGIVVPLVVLPKLPATWRDTTIKRIGVTAGISALTYMFGKRFLGTKNAAILSATMLGTELAAAAKTYIPGMQGFEAQYPQLEGMDDDGDDSMNGFEVAADGTPVYG